jgi:hypothetical protein
MMPACDAACAVAVAVAKAKGIVGIGKIGVPPVEPPHPGNDGVTAQGVAAKTDGDAKHNRLPTSNACTAQSEADRLHQDVVVPEIPLNIRQPPKSKNKNR